MLKAKKSTQNKGKLSQAPVPALAREQERVAERWWPKRPGLEESGVP